MYKTSTSFVGKTYKFIVSYDEPEQKSTNDVAKRIYAWAKVEHVAPVLSCEARIVSASWNNSYNDYELDVEMEITAVQLSDGWGRRSVLEIGSAPILSGAT